MITKAQLQQLATAQSYSRGEAYYRSGAVRTIQQNGRTFTGRVFGSVAYQVTITLRNREPDFECSCPYEFGGSCKHCVAFGLAVINQFGTINLMPEPAAPSASTIDLDQLWQHTATEQKLAFLRQLLDKQLELRSQLAQFAGSPLTAKLARPGTDETVDDISTAVFEALSDLRFDDDTLDLEEDDYYSEDGPDPEPVLEDVLQEYANRVSRAFGEGRLADGMTVYLGVYEGIQSATDPAYDNYGIIGDYPSQVLAVWNRLLETDLTQLAQRVIAPDQLQAALRRLADRVHHFDESEHNDEELYYNLKDFEPLLLALVTDMPSAREVQRAIELYHWQQIGTEYVQLHLADVFGQWTAGAGRLSGHRQLAHRSESVPIPETAGSHLRGASLQNVQPIKHPTRRVTKRRIGDRETIT